MKVRLTRKLAECVDGVDLSSYREGDVLALSSREAELLVAEGWALPVNRAHREVRGHSTGIMRAQAADTQRDANRERLQTVRRVVDLGSFEPHAYRRIEDHLRDELHDVHARVINGSATRSDESLAEEPTRKIASSSTLEHETRRHSFREKP